jgi:hypothetical protein
MTKAPFPSDTISLKDISTGHNNAGNGGNGYNSGPIINNPSIDYQPYNKAEGAKVDVSTGDHVDQKAYWDAGGANASADWLSKAKGGDAESNGSQWSSSGHDTSIVSADTTAYQSNFIAADMGQYVEAGNGGYGGNGNKAEGGDVYTDPTIANLDNVLNDSQHNPVPEYMHG